MPVLSDLHFAAVLPESAVKAFTATFRIVSDKFQALGVPESWLAGPISFEIRAPGNIANGRYDSSKNLVSVYLPQIRRTAVDIPWVLAHELAHRLWTHRLSSADRARWSQTIMLMGTPFQPEAVKVAVHRAAQSSTLYTPKQHEPSNPFWFWYRQNHGNDIAGYANYLRSAKYVSAGLPRGYSNVTPDEAWADVVSNLVLGRSHASSLMRQSAFQIRQLALNLLRRGQMSEAKENKFDYASTQVDIPEVEDDLRAWLKKNIEKGWLAQEPLDKPHVTLLWGLLSNNPGPVRSVAKSFGKPIALSVGALDYFDTPDYDVLYAKVESRDLQKLHKALKKLPNKEDYENYTPHLTVAYLKKGHGKKFKGQKPFKAVLTKRGFLLSSKDGTKEFVPTIERSPLFGEIPKRGLLKDTKESKQGVDKSKKTKYSRRKAS